MQNAANKPGQTNAVSEWFAEAFFELHTQLQMLHRHGGVLTGKVELQFGRGLAGFIGKRIARKLGVPRRAGEHDLRVEIRHREDGLHWSRCFDERQNVLSIFKPVGKYPEGYWIEKTGPVTLKLGVDIIESGWHWRVLGIRALGLPMPLMLFPHSSAYKKIVGDHYQFNVSFSMPWIGRLFSYQGRLFLSQPDPSGIDSESRLEKS
ncbi:MAG: DUF4166 domain-containing protein [Arenimonas sp.]